jgi:hypothetical protein
VGLRAGLDDVEKRKFLTLRDLNSNPSVVQLVASPISAHQYNRRVRGIPREISIRLVRALGEFRNMYLSNKFLGRARHASLLDENCVTCSSPGLHCAAE